MKSKSTNKLSARHFASHIWMRTTLFSTHLRSTTRTSWPDFYHLTSFKPHHSFQIVLSIIRPSHRSCKKLFLENRSSEKPSGSLQRSCEVVQVEHPWLATTSRITVLLPKMFRQQIMSCSTKILGVYTSKLQKCVRGLSLKPKAKGYCSSLPVPGYR